MKETGSFKETSDNGLWGGADPDFDRDYKEAKTHIKEEALGEETLSPLEKRRARVNELMQNKKRK